MTHDSPAVKAAIKHDVPAPIARALYRAAEKHGLPYSLCLAVSEHESGFRNVWGHDAGKKPQGGEVTAASVKAYLAGPSTSRPQGVGPMQITSKGLQDRAIEEGGLEDPVVTTEVGVGYLAACIEGRTRREGVRAYNGSGPAAEHYALVVMAAAQRWHAMVSPADEH